MQVSNELCEEMNLLLQYDVSTSLAGLKIHSSAAEEVIAAAKRLFDKGLVDHVDGGYLTDLGRETAEHLQSALRILVV